MTVSNYFEKRRKRNISITAVSNSFKKWSKHITIPVRNYFKIIPNKVEDITFMSTTIKSFRKMPKTKYKHHSLKFFRKT